MPKKAKEPPSFRQVLTHALVKAANQGGSGFDSKTSAKLKRVAAKKRK